MEFYFVSFHNPARLPYLTWISCRGSYVPRSSLLLRCLSAVFQSDSLSSPSSFYHIWQEQDADMNNDSSHHSSIAAASMSKPNLVSMGCCTTHFGINDQQELLPESFHIEKLLCPSYDIYMYFDGRVKVVKSVHRLQKYASYLVNWQCTDRMLQNVL